MGKSSTLQKEHWLFGTVEKLCSKLMYRNVLVPMPNLFQEKADDYIIYVRSSDGVLKYLDMLFWSWFEKNMRSHEKKSWIWVTAIDSECRQVNTISTETIQIMNQLKTVDELWQFLNSCISMLGTINDFVICYNIDWSCWKRIFESRLETEN